MCPMCRGPTSFTGLIPSLPPADTSKVRRLKTFQDVAIAKQRAVAPPRVPLSQTDWLPPALPLGRTTSTAADGEADAATAAQLALANSLPPMASAPMDWSLKTSVRFASSVPFTIWQEARLAPRADVIRAQRAFLGCTGGDALSLQQQLLAACMSWQFPQDPQDRMPLAKVRDAGKGAMDKSYQGRWQDWASALSALYDLLRCGSCDAFYVVFRPADKGGASRRRQLYFSALRV